MFTANIYDSEDTGSNQNGYQHGRGKASSGIPTLRNEYWLKVRLVSVVDMERSQTLLGEQERFRTCSVLCYLYTRRKPLYAYNCLRA